MNLTFYLSWSMTRHEFYNCLQCRKRWAAIFPTVLLLEQNRFKHAYIWLSRIQKNIYKKKNFSQFSWNVKQKKINFTLRKVCSTNILIILMLITFVFQIIQWFAFHFWIYEHSFLVCIISLQQAVCHAILFFVLNASKNKIWNQIHKNGFQLWIWLLMCFKKVQGHLKTKSMKNWARFWNQ